MCFAIFCVIYLVVHNFLDSFNPYKENIPYSFSLNPLA